MRETLRFIRAFYGFRKDHMAGEVRPIAQAFDLYTTWTEDEKGCWTKGENDFSPMLPVAATIDQNLVDKVAALKVKKHLFLEIGVFPVPVGNTPSGRGKMSKLVMLVDKATTYVLNARIVETPDDRETDWAPIVEMVLNGVCALGFRPEMFASSSRKMDAILKGLCATDFKGTKVMEHSPCYTAKAAFADISAGLFGR